MGTGCQLKYVLKEREPYAGHLWSAKTTALRLCVDVSLRNKKLSKGFRWPIGLDHLLQNSTEVSDIPVATSLETSEFSKAYLWRRNELNTVKASSSITC